MKQYLAFLLSFFLIALCAREGKTENQNCLAPATIWTAETQDWNLIRLRFTRIYKTALEAKDLTLEDLDFLKNVMQKLNGNTSDINPDDDDFVTQTLAEMDYILQRLTDPSNSFAFITPEQQQTHAFIISQLSNEILLHDMSHFMRYLSFLSVIIEDPSLDKTPKALDSARQIMEMSNLLNEKQQQQRNLLRHFLLQNNKEISSRIYLDMKDMIIQGYDLSLKAIELIKLSERGAPYLPFIEADKKECEEFLSMLERWEKNPDSLRNSSIHAYNESLGILEKLQQFHGFNITLLSKTPFNLKLKMAAHELYYLFFTLCDNAKDAESPDRKLKLKIGISRIEKENKPYCRIIVTDNAKGMSPEILQTIRDGKKITTKGKMGSGVGLDSIRNLLTSLGASWDLQSAEGTGTTFTLYIPGEDISEATKILLRTRLSVEDAA